MKVFPTSHGVPRHPTGTSQDASRVLVRDGRVIAALADGVGSSQEGGAAAQRAVDMIVDYYVARPQAWTPRRALTDFVSQINRIFHQESQLRHGSSELLCTLTVAVIENGRLYGLNIGDSPAYLWRRAKLTRLSQNHALSQNGMQHVLTRAVGLEPTVEPWFFENTVEDGDMLLLCSDGVSNAVSENQLAELLSRRTAARSIVSSAAERIEENSDLRDDATAVVLDIAQRGWTGGTGERPLEVLPALRPGDIIDNFKLLRPLQDTARVWLAEKLPASASASDHSTFNLQPSTHAPSATGARCVLKFPPLEARDEDARRDGFLRELWQASRIDSPDFIRATIPAEGSLRYYVMDYVEAPTLRAHLANGSLRVEETVELARFLLRSGQYLLSRDHAHGDIKPDNILVLRDGENLRFLLIDLGSAAEVFSVTNRAGTPSYLAPERFQNAPLSERTELFAIGVTLYESLVRTYPYGEIERFQTPRFDTSPKRLTRLNTAVPPWLESVISRSLAPDPDDRYQNFSEMAYDLDHPNEVTPFYAKNTALLDRDPVRFYKLLSLALFLTNIALLWHRLRR
ncbi:serine/threonine protein phosphatase [Nibricoccus aquaticus]|uniref:Serine/threonine protein phosphatase n=2 Tax=Nibricoccus aquaticus TaxID=2576891 RepID=A0A290QF85_9BACT|nr:serine/threonine protein phosphatase [Nibricoccus aquaticus]